MWNYYKTVVINSDKTEDGKNVFSLTNVFDPTTKAVNSPAANVWRNGQYELSKVGKITKTKAVEGQKQELTLTCTALEAGDYLLSFKVEMDGKFLSDYASPAYDGFYKPIVVAFKVADGATADAVAKTIAEKIELALPENNKFIVVDYTSGAVVTLKATDFYMFVKPEDVVLQVSVLPACGDSCLGEYVDATGVTAKTTVESKQPFATGTWLLENQRLPNSNNFRYFGFNDEMPIASAKYVQYSFDYVSDRPGLGGHSGVGQGITAITNHTFFVIESAAKAFETAFADAKGGFDGDPKEE